MRAWYIVRALTRASDRDFTSASVLDRAFDRDLALDFALALARDLARAFDRDFARALDLDLDRTLDLPINLCEELKLVDLGERLKQLKRPAAESPHSQWETFAQALQTIINEFRDLSGVAHLRQWDEQDEQFIQSVQWDEGQLEACMQYLRGTALLIDCLQLAAVSDRMGIEGRLLLPASVG